jgi:hypothetical protein
MHQYTLWENALLVDIPAAVTLLLGFKLVNIKVGVEKLV